MATGEKKAAARRLTAAVTAFLMMLMMAAVLLPGMKVSAAYQEAVTGGITVTVNPTRFTVGQDFSLDISFSQENGMPCPNNSKVIVSGYGGVTGKCEKTVTNSLYIPYGTLTFDGSDNSGIEIKVDGYANVYRYQFKKDVDYKDPGTSSGGGSGSMGEVIGTGNIKISNYTLSPNYIAYGRTTSLNVTVENTGTAALEDVAITLGGLATGSITVSGGQMDTTYQNIPANSKVTVTFTIAADEGITTGTQILNATATCGDLSSKLNIYVQTYGKGEQTPDEDKPAPELIGNQIVVSENAYMPEIEAGETKSILIPLEAKSTVVGTAQVTLVMPDGLYLNSAAATQSVSFGRSRSETLVAEVTARKDVTDSVVPITIKSVYEYDGKQVTEETTFSVRLKASQQIESNGKLVITGYTLGASTLSYNGNTTLDITVQNKGDAAMKDISMTLDGLATGSVTLRGGMDVQTLAELLPGQNSTFTYQLHADENVPDGTVILTATAACGEETSAAKVFIPCIAKPEEVPGDGSSGPGSSKPQVIIESYTYGDTGVTGGSTFNLAMTLRNTSASTAIENIKMVISSAADDTTGGVFTPASSSNSFYIARVPAGETFSENIDLTVKADAPPKSYGIDVELSYEAVIDGTRQTLTANERITIPVSQPDRFEVDEVQISDYNYVGDSIWCQLNYVNKGKSAIYNLSIAVEGTGFTTGDTNTYVGNVEAGSGDYFEVTLNASEAGQLEGKFILTYEDSAGNETTIERPFSTMVQEMDWGNDDPGMDDPGMIVDDEPAGLPLWGKIAIGAGCAVLICGIVFVSVRLRKAKKRRASLEDDEDDDGFDYEDDGYDE